MKKADNREFALQWLIKAEHDLITARQTLSMKSPPTDTPCFHAQQAVEKSLKALLTFRGVEFPKTHDLLVLLDFANKLTDKFEIFREKLAEMNSYAVEARYPGDFYEPPIEDAMEALKTAEDFTEKIKALLI
jgi:HEPN domain-containing protein